MDSQKPQKPIKPYPDFPLFAHAGGKWAKKINGKMIYFGKWADPEGAMEEYQAYLNDPLIKYSLKPKEPMTIEHACQLFVKAKNQESQSGALADRTAKDYERMCKRVIKFFGRHKQIKFITPHDFHLLKSKIMERYNLVTTGNEITRIKTLFRWLASMTYIGPVAFGPDFKKPSAKSMRRHRRLAGKKLFSAEQIRHFLDESGVHMRAMILLGINCGYGNNDCNLLPVSEVRLALETGWLEFPRPKTEMDRRAYLWDITRQTLEESFNRRSTSTHLNFFIKATGKPYTHENCDISKRFRHTRIFSNVHIGGFYWLRHTFATVAGACADPVALDYVMGHVDGSMAANYRHEIEDSRLHKISHFVHQWLFGNWQASTSVALI